MALYGSFQRRPRWAFNLFIDCTHQNGRRLSIRPRPQNSLFPKARRRTMPAKRVRTPRISVCRNHHLSSFMRHGSYLPYLASRGWYHFSVPWIADNDQQGPKTPSPLTPGRRGAPHTCRNDRIISTEQAAPCDQSSAARILLKGWA